MEKLDVLDKKTPSENPILINELMLQRQKQENGKFLMSEIKIKRKRKQKTK